MRSKGVRRVVVVVALVAVMVVGRVQPAGAFLSSLDPAGWAVVAQMAAIISQAVAIKRQVENVRNQARAEFFGKLAPLTGKLTVVSGWLRNARTRAGVSIYNPASFSALLPTTSLPEFNRPLDECAPGPAGVDPCMPPITSAALPSGVVTDLSTWYRRNVVSTFGLSPLTRAYTAADGRIGEAASRLDGRMQDAIARQVEAARRGENERAMARALIEEQMAIVEDWRGCQEAPPNAWSPPGPAVDDRLPCMTNRGLGREDAGGGTQGAQSDLVAKIDALERYQDGDISKVQLDTLQTQLIVTLGRLQAARIEREAAALEQSQEAAMLAEAARRRAVDLQAAEFRCRAAFGVQSRFLETMPPQVPPVGRCLQVQDVSAAVIAAASASCMIDGRC
ncbi:MAG: hypothetical protein F4018_11905 [Acidobacteria bacterium]|nr:hypothetical protein [Acidobacteriota bacterium]MYK88974.1 hypothetical protein [Acidobacteriota bacterium]